MNVPALFLATLSLLPSGPAGVSDHATAASWPTVDEASISLVALSDGLGVYFVGPDAAGSPHLMLELQSSGTGEQPVLMDLGAYSKPVAVNPAFAALAAGEGSPNTSSVWSHCISTGYLGECTDPYSGATCYQYSMKCGIAKPFGGTMVVDAIYTYCDTQPPTESLDYLWPQPPSTPGRTPPRAPDPADKPKYAADRSGVSR